MIAVIDADIICYEFGNMRDLESTEILPWPIVRKFVDERIAMILEESESTDYIMYLTDSKSNFRIEAATIVPYKGKRPSDKPPHWENIREHLIEQYDAKLITGMEADDACGIVQYTSFFAVCMNHMYGGNPTKDSHKTIICSRDKDLDMIPGWHYQWECGKQAMRRWFIDEQDAIRSFYKQLLTGDSTDNILGLFGVGKAAACVKRIDNYDTEQEMFNECLDRYTERFGSYARQFLEENAKLLWILRTDNTNEIIERLDPLFTRYEADKEVVRNGEEEES